MFWQLTPREFTGLCERHRLALRREDTHFAMVAAVIANTVRGKNQRPARIEDFMPQERSAQTPAQQAQLFQMFVAAAAGRN